MNCKCGELKLWLKNEIKNLEDMKKNITCGTSLHDIIDAKILAYTIVFDGLTK